jgi:hypothetical protein
MDRITGATVDIGSGRRGFRGRNLFLSQAGTIPGADWFNGAQEEIIRAIEILGLTPSDANREQLIQAMRRLAGGNVRTITAGGVTLTADDAGMVLVNASGSFGITLPAANGAGGLPQRLTFVRTDTATGSTVTLSRAGSDTIEGATSWPLRVGDRLTLISDGALSWRTVGDDADRLIGVQIFTSGGTYTPTPGTSKVIVEAVGGGGGGAGSAVTVGNGTSIGGCGAAGAGGRGRYTSGFSGVTVTIGVGGTAGGVGSGGGNGGATSFGALLSCPGGVGGTASLAGTTPLAGGNGNQAVPTGANIYAHRGGNGSISQALDGSSSYGGNGGASMFGPGGSGPSVNSVGQAGVTPGSGGSGTAAYNNGSGVAGAAGAAGLILVWEYS